MSNVNSKNRLFAIGIVVAVAMMLVVPLAQGTLLSFSFSDAEDTAPTYSVSYDKNSTDALGSVPDPGDFAEGSSVNVLFDKIPSNTLYAFVGWEAFQGATSLGVFYPDESRNNPSDGSETLARAFTMPSEAVVLKAVWSTESDTMVISSAGQIVFDYQGGEYTVTSGGNNLTVPAGVSNFIIQSSADTWSDGISVLNTAAKDSAARLRIVLDSTTSNAINITTDASSPSAFAVLNSSYVNLQYAGNISFTVNNLNAAIVNVAPSAEIMIMGENDSSGSEYSMSLSKSSTGANRPSGSGIGGNNLEDAGAIRMESGAVTITLSSQDDHCYASGIGGGGTTSTVENGTAGSATYVEINGGTLTITKSGHDKHAAIIGGGGSRSGTPGNSGYVVINGGIQNLTENSFSDDLYGTGIGGGGTATTSDVGGGNFSGFVFSGGELSISMVSQNPTTTSCIFGAAIGGGGTLDGPGGTMGTANITGGSITIYMSAGTDQGIYGAGIGGGGVYDTGPGGAGGNVSIKDSSVSITMNTGGDINGAGIGGGGSMNTDAGSNGTTTIESSAVTITQTSTSDMVAGAGIGGGGHTYNTMNDGSGGTVTIKSGTVNITQTASEFNLNAAGIGGGGAYQAGGVPGGGGVIDIEGGNITISKNGNQVYRGAGIGGGGRYSTDNKGVSGNITISGGSVDISFGSGTNSTVAIGGGTGSDVTINGGTITMLGTPSSAQDIGTYASGINSLVINGGSIKTMNNRTLTGAVNDNGSPLYKVTVGLNQGSGVTLPSERDLYSVFVKSDSVNDGRYRDFHVPYKNLNALGSTAYDTNIYLYLPAVNQEISAEVTSDGQVKWYVATVSNADTVAAIEDGSNVYYRVLYQGTGLRFKNDTVHALRNSTFSDILESSTGDASDGTPHTITVIMGGSEVPSTNYAYTNSDDQTPTSAGGQITGPTVTGKLTVMADSEKVYQITYLDLANQSNSYTVDVYAGEETTLAAADLFEASAGRTFIGWRYAGGVMAAGAAYTPTSNIIFYADWASTGINITITGSNVSVQYPLPTQEGGNIYSSQSGDDFTFVLQVATGYDPTTIQFEVTGTAGSITGSNGLYKLASVSSDTTIAITVSKQSFEVTVGTDSTGNFYTIDKTQETVEYGDNFTFTLTPQGDHLLSDFTPVVNGVEMAFNPDGSLTVPITGPTTISIDNSGQHRIPIPDGPGYTISPSGGGVVDDGDSFTFTVTLDPGYSEDATNVALDGSYGDVTEGEWVDGSKTYTVNNVTGNIDVDVTTAKNQYTVKVPTSANYTISSTNTQDAADPDYLVLTVDYGDNASFTLTVADGYDISRFTVTASAGGSNGSILAGQNGTWIVNSVIGDMELQITEMKYQYRILYSLTNCAVSGSIGQVEWGDSINVTIVRIAGYEYGDLTVTGAEGMYGWTYDKTTGSLNITNIKTDIQVTAVSVASTYTIAYDPNLGTGGPGPQEADYNTQHVITGTNPTRTGYSFLGWSTDPNSATAEYVANDTITVTSSITLYAVWSKTSVTVTYTAGAGATGTDVTDGAFMYDEYKNLSGLPDGWSMDGYTLTGWTDSNSNTYSLGELAKFTANMTLTGIWTPNSPGDITVTYDGSGAGGNYTETWQENVQGTLGYPHAALAGNDFAGWKIGDTDTVLAAGAATTFAADATVYAQWTPIAVTVTFDANKGTGAPASQPFSYGVAAALTADEPTMTGYTFLGWSADPNAASETYESGGTASFTADTTLYAVWSANALTITYSPGTAGTGTQAVQNTVYDNYTQLYNASQVDFARSGYHLVGWTDTDGNTAILYGLDDVVHITSALVLYPVWEQDGDDQESVTITFDPDYSSGPSTFTQTVTSGNATALTYQAFDRTGYTFIGWSNDLDSSTAAYQPGGEITVTDATTLYAVWSIIELTVAFNANGGTGTMADQTVDYGTDENLSASAFSRTGNMFMGWSTDPNGSVEYVDGALVNITADAVLYAIWSKLPLTVTYIAGAGATGDNVPDAFVYDEYKNLSGLPAGWSMDGYTLTGWTDGDSNTYALGELAKFTASTALNGIWTQNDAGTAVITFDPDYSSGPSTFTQTVTSGAATALTYQTFDREGYTFLGWADASGSSAAAYQPGDNIIVAGDTTLYAVWQIVEVTITFNANGGTGTMDPQAVDYNVATALETNAFLRTGYEFQGWSTDPNGTVTYAEGASVTLQADVTVYAIWAPNILTVTYNAGTDGTGSQKVQFTYHGNYVQLYAEDNSGFTRTGYHAIGWTDTDGGATVLYGLGATVQTMADLILYPVWEQDGDDQNSVTITFESDYAGGPAAFTQDVTSGAASTLTHQTFTREGYTFLGWSEDSNPSPAAYQPGGEITVTAEITLYAVWQIIKVTVTFDANLGTGAPAAQTFDHGVDTALTSDEPTREGYAFLGWSADPNATTATYVSGDTVSFTADTTVYAAWDPNDLTVTYEPGALGTGTQQVQDTYYGENVLLYSELQTGFTYAGYSMLGWTDTDGSSTILYGLGNNTYMTADLVLYPVWGEDSDLVPVVIQFLPGYESDEEFAQQVYSGVETPLTYQTFARDGYTFMGWTDVSGSSAVEYQPGGNITVTSQTTLYAIWELVQVEITYSANGGTGGTSSQMFGYGMASNLTTNTPTMAGYVFLGWSSSPSATSEMYTAGSAASFTSPATLYAVWMGATVQVSYDLSGGTWTDANTQSARVGDNYQVSNVIPTKDGFDFKGWNTSSDGTGTTYGAGSSAVMPVTGLQLYALWDVPPGTSVVAIQTTGAEGTFTYSIGDSHPQDINDLIVTAQTGDLVTLKATAPDNATFDYWMVDGTKYYTDEVNVTADGAKTAYAYFVPSDSGSAGSIFTNIWFWIIILIIAVAVAAVVVYAWWVNKPEDGKAA